MGRLKRRENVCHHTFEVGVDVRVPKSQRLEALAFQHGVPNRVVSGLDLFSVTTTIDFDDQAAAETDEIEVIAPKGCLTTEVRAPGTQSSQLDPQSRLLR